MRAPPTRPTEPAFGPVPAKWARPGARQPQAPPQGGGGDRLRSPNAGTQQRASPVLLIEQGGRAKGQRDNGWQPRRQNRIDDPIGPQIAHDFSDYIKQKAGGRASEDEPPSPAKTRKPQT